MKGFFKSSIGKKVIMSVSGLFLILFLLFHLCMNLVVVFSPCAYNSVCAFLGSNWYAVAGTMVLAAGFLLHIIYAFVLTVQNRKARGNDRYDCQNLPKDVEFSSKNMLALGLVVCCGLLVHFGQFWAKMMFAELAGCEEAAKLATNGAHWINWYFHDCDLSVLFVIVYLVWFTALWFHLNHGFWSAFHTVGLSNNVWIPRLKCAAKWFSTIVCVLFAFVVIWAALGNVEVPECCGNAATECLGK
jgi:succinate dehydrogenase / fumarate reductase cytochrome b subunit